MSEIIQTKLCNGPLCNGIHKNISEFSPTLNICKKCNCHKTKEYYKTNDRPYRKYVNDVKKTSECYACGCNDMRLLEFDHFDTNKNITISKSFSRSKIQNELQYTQILCIWCHRLKTRVEIENKMKEQEKQYTISSRPISVDDGKICNGKLCNGKLQYKTEFYNINKGVCKPCNSYRTKLIRQENYNFVKNIKLSSECQLCNIKVTEETINCFDYDHTNPVNKLTNIAILVRQNKKNQDIILKEIKKCRLLCCKCHKIHTASQLNYKYTHNIENKIE